MLLDVVAIDVSTHILTQYKQCFLVLSVLFHRFEGDGFVLEECFTQSSLFYVSACITEGILMVVLAKLSSTTGC